MIKKTTMAVSALAIFTGAAIADPFDDATYIAEALMTDEVIAVSFDAINDVLISTVIVELANVGLEVSDDATKTLTTMMLESLKVRSTSGLRKIHRDLYLETLSPETLADFREFLETASGQEYASIQGTFMAEIAARGGVLGEELGIAMIADVQKDITQGDFPDSTTGAVKKELSSLFQTLGGK